MYCQTPFTSGDKHSGPVGGGARRRAARRRQVVAQPQPELFLGVLDKGHPHVPGQGGTALRGLLSIAGRQDEGRDGAGRAGILKAVVLVVNNRSSVADLLVALLFVQILPGGVVASEDHVREPLPLRRA